MSFLNPIYLWALFGLLIPITIHLWSKKEGKTIKVGSIKLLREEDSKQSSSISLNELLLLFLRLSLIALVVLIVAEPQIKKETTNTPMTYIIEPSLVTNENISPLLDSLKTKSKVLLLKPKLPEFTDEVSDITDYDVPNYWQLAKAMESLKTDSIIVFTTALASGLKGKRPIIKTPIEWIVFDPEPSEEQVIKATLRNDDIALLSAISQPKHLLFRKEYLASTNTKIDINASKDSVTVNLNEGQQSLALLKEAPLNVLLFYQKKFENEAIYIDAGLRAISKHLKREIQINKTEDSLGLDIASYQHIVWLSDHAINVSNTRLLYYKEDHLANTIITQGELEHSFYITRPLNIENILDERLTHALLSWLNLHHNLEEKIKSLDKRVVSKAELLPIYKGIKENNTYINTVSISKWLWLLVAFLLIVERSIAHIRKQ